MDGIVWTAIVIGKLATEIKGCVINPFTKGINDSYRCLRSNKILQAKDACLAPVRALNIRHKEHLTRKAIYTLKYRTR